MNKTNAMRILDKAKIKYEALEYKHEVGSDFGESIARVLNLDPNTCLKSLVVSGNKDLYLCVIPVNKQLDEKKVASYLNIKSVEMYKTKDLLKAVGYQRGSVSPIGIKNIKKIFIDESVNNYEYVEVSGGTCGISLKINTKELIDYLNLVVLDVVRDKE